MKMFNTNNLSPEQKRRINGFTLMELLIVMAIITILMLIAIPTTQTIFKNVHQLSAKQSLKAIETAQVSYNSQYGTFTCNLAALGGDPAQGPASAQSAQLLKSDLAGGYKDGYNFAIVNCSKSTSNNQERVNSYQATATPAEVGKTGTLGYCLDSYGNLKQDSAGGTNCTEDVR